MEGFIGEIRIFAGNFAPRSWAFCEGQLLPIAQNSALFSILGTTYGGDGRTTFGLPDMRGRVPIGQGNGPGLSDRRLGAKGGTETNTITVAQLPSHNHTAALAFNTAGPTSNNPNNAFFSGVTASSSDGVTYVAASFNNDSTSGHFASNVFDALNTGGGQASNNKAPTIAIYYIIALFGVYPSRS